MNEKHLIVVVVGSMMMTLFAYFVHPLASLALLGFSFFIIFFARFFEIGWYLLIILHPFVELQIIWKEINVPVGDALAMILIVALVLRVLIFRKFSFQELIREHLPMFGFFAIFFLSVLPSFLVTPDVGLSIKYFLRPLLFLYLMFIVLPSVALSNERVLYRSFVASYILGMIVAFMGFASFFVSEQPQWLRAIPVSFGGIMPLGSNHNIIAEVLVSIMPLGWWLAERMKDPLHRKMLMLGNLFLAIITLLTFSRAGWIVLAFQLVLYGWLKRSTFRRLSRQAFLLGGVMLLPFLLLMMYFFSQTPMVESSNANRMLLYEIAQSAWRVHPFIGNGLSTFQSFVQENTVYILEFGGAMDAHGVLQKLLVEVGLIGASAFLLLLGALTYRLLVEAIHFTRSDPWQGMIIASSVAAFGIVIFEFFNTSYFISTMWLPIGIALASVRLAKTYANH